MYKMQRLEVSGAVRPIYGSLGVKALINKRIIFIAYSTFRFNLKCRVKYTKSHKI